MRKKEYMDPVSFLVAVRQSFVLGVIAGDADAPRNTPQPNTNPDRPDFELPDEPVEKGRADWLINTAFEFGRMRRIEQRIELRDAGWRPELAIASEGRSMAERVDRLYDGGGISRTAERNFR